MGLAATIGNLDLILTVDTLAAHLAGALGVPTWLLLKQEADWRWMIGRSDSPWYPSLRIFRQPAPGTAKASSRRAFRCSGCVIFGSSLRIVDSRRIDTAGLSAAACRI